MNKIIRFLGLRGSWLWACRQMAKGLRVRRRSSVGAVRYQFSRGGPRRIVYATGSELPRLWNNATLFASDFEATDWEVVW